MSAGPAEDRHRGALDHAGAGGRRRMRSASLVAAIAVATIVGRPDASTPTAEAGWCVPRPVFVISRADASRAGPVAYAAGAWCKRRARKPEGRPTRCTDAWARFRTMSTRNFRWNLCVLTRQNPRGHDAHHVFPLKRGLRFARIGMNVNNPFYGAWWASGPHRSAAKAYNRAWDRAAPPSRSITSDGARRIACRLAARFRFIVRFSCYNGPH